MVLSYADRIKLDLLSVGDVMVVQLEHSLLPLAVGPGYIPIGYISSTYSGFFEPIFYGGMSRSA